MMFADRLSQAIIQKQTPLMVGLDPRLAQLPPTLQTEYATRAAQAGHFVAMAEVYRQFCSDIIDVVASQVAVIKPQMAFFEAAGSAGLLALERLLVQAKQQSLMVVLDGKRGDIGSTAEAYAEAYLNADQPEPWPADALTVNPWLGLDSLAPFVKRATQTNSGIFVLVKTSNPGSRDYQEQRCQGQMLFQRVADNVESLAQQTLANCQYGAVGAVVGATYPDELAQLRQAMPHTWFLVPGFGAQGGSAQDVAAGFDARGLGAVVNSSRNIIFAYDRPAYQSYRSHDWQRAVELATQEAIDQLATDTPAKVLRAKSTV